MSVGPRRALDGAPGHPVLPEAILISLFLIIFKGMFTLGFSLVDTEHPESWFALWLAATCCCTIVLRSGQFPGLWVTLKPPTALIHHNSTEARISLE